jgi:ATP/maltotriose-dependent transcriptional regulator MalT
LREAVAHQILVVEAGGSYAFRHALVQEAIYDDLLPVQRPPLHAAYAHALAAQIDGNGSAGGAELGRLAYHWYAAHDAGRALLASIQAGLAAEAAFAPAEAVVHYERALELWDQSPEAASGPLDRVSLLQHAALALSRTGDGRRAAALINVALEETVVAAEPVLAGGLLTYLAWYEWQEGAVDASLSTMERAVAIIPAEPPSAERAAALGEHGLMLMLMSRLPAAYALCQEAAAVAQRVGARKVEGRALNNLGSILGTRGQLDAGVAELDRAQAIAADIGDMDDLSRAYHNRGCIYLFNGRFEDAVRDALECRELARRFGLMGTRGLVAIEVAAEAQLWLGRFQEAELLIDEILDLTAVPRGVVSALLPRSLHRLWRGDLEGAREDLTSILGQSKAWLDPENSAVVLSRLATVATWEGRLEEARTAVADGLVALPELDEPRLVADLCLAGIAAEAAIAQRATAQRDHAARAEASRIAAELLARARATAKADGVAIIGSARAKLLAVEAEWTRVDEPADPDRWAEAVDAWDELGCLWPAAYSRWRLAEALLGHGAARGEAAVPLRQAWATAQELGARALMTEVESLARRTRIALASEPDAAGEAVPPAAPDDRLGLTPREKEVLALLADGRSNRQIAGALFISDKTASVHVSNILAKLGVTNRAAAAATAHRLGLLAVRVTDS